jgi:pimeloyl-ACP methyl ester carboxylesterase
MDSNRQSSWHFLDRGGERLACLDYGGDGPAVVLLHGLAGHAEEWSATASWLARSHRVLALDARGHGRSGRQPVDVSRAAHVDDVSAWLDHFAIAGAVVVGQSLGAQTAFLFASLHPELVLGLVVAEASPEPEPEEVAKVRRWLEAWPVPFASREAALDFFGGDTLWAHAWAAGLEETPVGLRPRFDIEILLATLEEASARAYWEEWAAVRCPTLLIRAEEGLDRQLALRMIETAPSARLVEIERASHDVHLEQPEQWQHALEAFLKDVVALGT